MAIQSINPANNKVLKTFQEYTPDHKKQPKIDYTVVFQMVAA